MDLYAYVEEIHQNTSFVAAIDCFPSNRSRYRRLEARQAADVTSRRTRFFQTGPL